MPSSPSGSHSETAIAKLGAQSGSRPNILANITRLGSWSAVASIAATILLPDLIHIFIPPLDSINYVYGLTASLMALGVLISGGVLYFKERVEQTEDSSEHAKEPNLSAEMVEPTVRLGWLVFWMGGTLVSFIVGALSVRELAKSLSVFEMMTVRCAGSLLILAAVAFAVPGLWGGLRWRRMPLQITRGIVHFGSQICWALAITLLPFATVFALEFTIPAWVALLAVLFLGERMTASRALALAICFVGVLVILRPGLEGFKPAALIMLLGALFFAITAIMTKKLITTETTFAILFWMNLVQLPFNFVFSDPLFFLKLQPWMILALIGVTAGGLSAHYCLTNAFRCGDAIVVIPMDFLRVPIIAVIGYMFYGEHLDPVVFVGAAFIILGVLWNVRAERQRNGAARQTAV